MDFITHGLVGACVGQSVGRRTLGRRALYCGALSAMLPDVDMVASLGGNPLAVLLYHRGITHSLLFVGFVGSLLGWLVYRLYRRHHTQDTLRIWIILFVVCLLSHVVLDCFTTYGTQLFAPWSRWRFSFGAIGIIDPFYTLPFLIPFVMGVRNKVPYRTAPLVLIVTTTYLFWGMYQNVKAVDLAKEQLTNTSVESIHAYPMILQIFLRRIVVHTAQDVRVGFISTLVPQSIQWYCERKVPVPQAQAFMENEFAKVFAWFTENQYFILSARDEAGGSALMMMDLRFGYPGETVWGMWGLKAPANEITQPHFVKKSPARHDALGGLRAAFGGNSSFFLAERS